MQRQSRDLFGSPLIEEETGKLHLIAATYQTAGLWVVVASRIDSAGESTPTKGPAFENAVLQLFEDVGIPATNIDYMEDNVQYQCDAIALWGDDLFVIEAKNHTLPSSSVSHRSC